MARAATEGPPQNRGYRPSQAAALLMVTAHAIMLRTACARINATGAVDVFLITDCNECTRSQRDSIWCSQAASDDNFVSNGTLRISITEKKRLFGPTDGVKYCWAGTFGALLKNSGNYSNLFESPFVQANVGCDTQNLFYRQCIIPAQMAIILISIGCVVFVAGTTCMLFYCGCCKCLNQKGDDSRWGMCNRFCPWMPCSEPPKKDDKSPEWSTNPVTDDQQSKSLFGRAPTLGSSSAPAAGSGSAAGDAAGARKGGLSDLKKPALPGATPLTGPKPGTGAGAGSNAQRRTSRESAAESKTAKKAQNDDSSDNDSL